MRKTLEDLYYGNIITLRGYEQYIRCYIKPYLGDKVVSRVT